MGPRIHCSSSWDARRGILNSVGFGPRLSQGNNHYSIKNRETRGWGRYLSSRPLVPFGLRALVCTHTVSRGDVFQSLGSSGPPAFLTREFTR